MSYSEFIELLKVALWPIVALIILFVVRPHLSELMAKSKVKLSMFGQSIETTLSELGQVIEEQTESRLTQDHIQYLESLSAHGVKDYPSGIESNERKFLRPVRNSGLILTIPRDSFLSDARSVQLSALGRLYLRARRGTK